MLSISFSCFYVSDGRNYLQMMWIGGYYRHSHIFCLFMRTHDLLFQHLYTREWNSDKFWLIWHIFYILDGFRHGQEILEITLYWPGFLGLHWFADKNMSVMLQYNFLSFKWQYFMEIQYSINNLSYLDCIPYHVENTLHHVKIPSVHLNKSSIWGHIRTYLIINALCWSITKDLAWLNRYPIKEILMVLCYQHSFG